MICLKMHLKAKNTFGGSPEPPEVSGGAPCQTDMDCIKRVKVGKAKIEKIPNKSKQCFEPENHYSRPT